MATKLIEYLSGNLYSARRIRAYFLPILLENGQVIREQLLKEFVRLKATPDESQADYLLSLISNQLGQKLKDYLQQIISCEYPNHSWEKDNFKIRSDYIEFVRDVLEKAKLNTV